MRQRCRHSCFLCTRDRKISKKYIGILKSRVSWFPLPIPDLIYSRLSQCETKYLPLIVIICFFLYLINFIFSAFQTRKFRRYFTSLFLHLQVKELVLVLWLYSGDVLESFEKLSFIENFLDGHLKIFTDVYSKNSVFQQYLEPKYD